MIDLILLAIVVVSALLGLMRGFVGIVVSITAWLLAAWASFRFGSDAAHMMGSPDPSATHLFGGYLMVFIGTLIAVHVVGMLVKSAVRATHLGGVDRLFGFVLGVLRGALIACLVVLVAGFTPLTGALAWRQSLLLPVFEPGAGWMRAQLPEWRPSLPQVPDVELPDSLESLRNGVTSGDNVSLQDLSALLPGGLPPRDSWERPLQLPGNALPMPGALPDNIENTGQDPVEARPDPSDPANIDAGGQARPRSQQS